MCLHRMWHRPETAVHVSTLLEILPPSSLVPAKEPGALRRIRRALKLVEEAAADLTDEIIESYNIILSPKTPYTT